MNMNKRKSDCLFVKALKLVRSLMVMLVSALFGQTWKNSLISERRSST